MCCCSLHGQGANGGTAPGQGYCTVHVQTQEEAMEWESADPVR